MSLDAAQKQEVIKQFQAGPGDTGSPAVQIALLTTRIKHLTGHLKVHKGDHHTRLGLLKMVSQRKSLLKYLKRKDFSRYSSLLKTLSIRHQ